MAGYSIQPKVTLANGDTQEEFYSDLTQMGLYLGLIGPDLQFKMTEREHLGSLALGVGPLRMGVYGGKTNIQNLNFNSNLYIYFYNGDSAVNDSGLPSFMDNKLNVDDSKVIMFATNKTKLEDVTSLKEGIVKTRDSNLLKLGPWVGSTYNWPIGQGTGAFNNFCVSLVDLKNLQSPSGEDMLFNQPIFTGRFIHKESSNTNDEASSGYMNGELGYIRNNIEGITAENEILIKLIQYASPMVYNIETGDFTPYSGTYKGYVSAWGTNMVKIGDLYYGLTNQSTMDAFTTNSDLYVFSYNPTTGETKVGTSSVCSYLTPCTSIIAVNNELYVQTRPGMDKSTSSSYAIKLYKINLTNLNSSFTEMTLTNMPTFVTNKNYWTIKNFDEAGKYLLCDNFSSASYVFSNTSDVEGSIEKAIFVGNGQPLTYGGTSHIYASLLTQGFYFRTEERSASYDQAESNLFRNTNYYGTKALLCSEEASPLLTYASFGKTYDKNANTDFTTSYFIEAQKGVVTNA